ncbi:MAG TPA: CopD family protein [Gaiellaceae bacterium]
MLRRVLVVGVLSVLLLPAAAWAHANLVSTQPRNGVVLTRAPPVARFVFDDTVRAVSGVKAIRNGGGSVLAGKPRIVRGRTLVVPLRGNLADGDYTILWRALSDDGHRLAGVIAFSVGAGRSPPVPALSVRNRPGFTDVLSRWLFFAGLLTAVGAAVFRFLVGPVPSRLFLAAFLLVFVGVSGAIHDVSVSTRFGEAMTAAAVVSGCGAVAAVIAPLAPRVERLPPLLALLLVPIPSVAGHALDPGRGRIQVFVDIAHVSAASVWVGGLVALALTLRARSDSAVSLRRFSNVALASVLVLAATGVTRAVTELRSAEQIWTTGYGRALIVKTVLLLALVAIGWVNRHRLVPRSAKGALRRSVAAELALLAVLIGAVALLTDVRPGRDRVAVAAVSHATGPPPLPAREMVVQAQEDGDYGVALAVHPPGAEVVVLGPDGQGINGLTVEIDGKPAAPCGAGCYGAFASFGPRVTVSVDGRKLTFRLPRKPRPAGSLVAGATAAFRRLRSVDYLERLASSPRNRVVSAFTLESPNRLEYRIRGGASGIIIGSRRWDRSPGGKWEPSTQTPTPQPEPIWAGHFTNAYLLATTPSTYVVSFLKPIGPAWFTVVLDRRTLLPRTLQMTATSHFMKHRYTRFNAPRTIRPPR